MSGPRPLGPLVHSFFVDHLVAVKGLRPASVRSYRDTIRLLLCYIAEDKGTKITKLSLEDLSFERTLGFLGYLEHGRGNHVRTRNQRLAALHTLFDYIAAREPEMLGVCQRVAVLPMKRAAPAETHFLERDEVEALFRHLPRAARLALRDRGCCYSSTTPAREPKRLPTCVSGISSSTIGRLSVSTAKGQVADLPAVESDGSTVDRTAGQARHTSRGGQPCVPLDDRRCTDAVRYVQDRAAPRRASRRRSNQSQSESAHLPPHRGSTPA